MQGLWKKMVDFVFKGGNKGLVNDAIGSIDLALWDLKAKADGEPLWKTLGASTRRVKAYASGIDLCLTDDQIGEFYGSMAAQGVSAGKLKVGLDRDADLRRIGIMQDALAKSGKQPELLIDSNEYWSPKQAIRNIQAIESQFEIIWAEEPARRWDYRGLRKVSQGIRAAVATGENLDDVGEFMPLVANEAVDVLNIGVGNTGVTGAMIIADLAYAFELPVTMMNCPGQLHGPPGRGAAEPLDDGGRRRRARARAQRRQSHRGRLDRPRRQARPGHRVRRGGARPCGVDLPAPARRVMPVGPPSRRRPVRGRTGRAGVAGGVGGDSRPSRHARESGLVRLISSLRITGAC